MKWILQKIFGTRNKRQLKQLQPLVDEINQFEESYQKLSDEELKAKTGEFKERLKKGETLDDILPEAYAAVKNACRRLCGREVIVTGNSVVWEMIPYDVQLVGGVTLHKGWVAEMATGEGKTLVATLPLYLNALTGKNCQLVTTNDYLARRDSEWMGAVYTFLGLSVGCIQNGMRPPERREMYERDITYGTNSEFGFDYLRDMGMAGNKDDLVQRDHYFVIIDEVDSILIDEARTPLIISGPAAVSTHKFDKLNPGIADLFRRQTLLCARLMKEAKDLLDKGLEELNEEEEEQAMLKLCQVKMGMPKHKQLMRLMEEPDIRKAIESKESEIYSDNNRGYLQEVREELYFAVNERFGEADLTDKGRQQLNPNNPDAFVMPDLASELSAIDGNTELDEATKIEKRREAQESFDEQSEILQNITQLLRAYCLFEKDVQYVVMENKVMIVDENTGRLMPGRRFSEGLHQALEAKEGVKIERETQTLASITIQNYFRLYDKLSGMTGTAETEAVEFKDIYNLDLLVVPTNRPCQRIDEDDRIYKTKREKYNAIIADIEESNKKGQPVLVGTVSVEVSEVISRMLKRHGIPHSVLNAKNHQSEAEVIARAGLKGGVTISTNMAGRGTDIKLAPGVKEAGGLKVIGSERHDARRIDRQLRGRCSRQGDPGYSVFYASLEDNLMRLFGSDRVAGFMEKLGLEEGEELSHPWLNKSIERAQRRVEQQNFSIRKRTLQYDDVMNNQRAVIYGLRKKILLADELRELLFDFVFTAVDERLQEAIEAAPRGAKIDRGVFEEWLQRIVPVGIDLDELGLNGEFDSDEVVHKIVDKIEEAYKLQSEHVKMPDEMRSWTERQTMLSPIDKLYQQHLYGMDHLRQDVQLRAYGQRDPLVEYKREAFNLFNELMREIKDEIITAMFRPPEAVMQLHEMLADLPQRQVHVSLGQFGEKEPQPEQSSASQDSAGDPSLQTEEQPQKKKPMIIPIRRVMPKVGRNEPCPCGSGKKFKKCCGAAEKV